MAKPIAEQRVHTAQRGKVIVYSRPSAKTDNYYYRIRIPGHKKYERKSTRTNVREMAIEIAEARYAEMMYAQKNGFSVIVPTINELLDHYVEEFERKYKALKHVSDYTFKDKLERIELLRAYFGAMSANIVSLADTDRYHDWKVEERQKKLSDDEGKKYKQEYRVFNQARGQYEMSTRWVGAHVWLYKDVSIFASQRDLKVLMDVYDLAIKHKKIRRDEKPSISTYEHNYNRRGFFDDDTLDKINAYLSVQYDHSYGTSETMAVKRTATYTKGSRKGMTLTSSVGGRTNFQRAQTHIWFNLMLAFGLRTNEMMTLKWRNVRQVKDSKKVVSRDTGEEADVPANQVVIDIVPDKGTRGIKKRERTIHNFKGDAHFWIERLKSLRKIYMVDRDAVKNIANDEPDADEYLWLNWQGQPEYKQIRIRFGNILRATELGLSKNEAELPVDAQENVVSSYSLRHSVATQLVLQDKNGIYQIAKYLGTSIEMIEKHYGHLMNRKMVTLSEDEGAAVKSAGNDSFMIEETEDEYLYVTFLDVDGGRAIKDIVSYPKFH